MRSLAPQVLGAMPGTRDQIAAAAGVCRMTVSRQVKALHAAGKCHITRWMRPSKGPIMPVFAAGNGEDVERRVQVFTESERCARYRARRDKIAPSPFAALFVRGVP